MLVLSRHRDEKIMLGDDIVVTIVEIRGDKVRLGIDAPKNVPVHRQEVYEAIKREEAKRAPLGAFIMGASGPEITAASAQEITAGSP
jgi:carbon storage regulator